MNPYSLLSFTAFIVYLYVGIYALRQDAKAALNRSFFALNLCFAFWSLSNAFLISAGDLASCVFWDKAASLGYYTFASCALHFILIYTKKKKLLGMWWFYIVIYLPAVIFIYEKFTGNAFIEKYVQGDSGWLIIYDTGTIWFWANLAQYSVYCIIGLALCYIAAGKARSPAERKQAYIIIISGISAFLISNAIYFTVVVSRPDIPNITDVGLVFWSAGILHAMSRYRLMKLTPAMAAENILETIVDSVILINGKGTIINVNRETERLLDRRSGELVGGHIGKLFPDDIRFGSEHIKDFLGRGPVRNAEAYFRSGDGTKIPLILSVSECKDDEDRVLGYVIVSRDITRLRDMEKQMKYLAHHDSLTGLPNRLLFRDRMEQAMARAVRYDSYVALMILDLDNFKEINDRLGHVTGDCILKETADRITTAVRKCDTVVRLGGDEFVVLLNDIKDAKDHAAAAQKILDRISVPFAAGNHDISVTASIGISIYPVNGNNMEDLMKCADLAMYHAKSKGRNCYQLFTPVMSMTVMEKIDLEDGLREVLKNNELALYYQPVVDLSDGKVTAVEALVRWEHPKYGTVTPAKFIRFAEENGYMVQIGAWVLRTACEQAKQWQHEGYGPINVSVNLSAQQFRHKGLLKTVLGILNETGLDPAYLMLEITESTAAEDPEYSTDIIGKLHENEIKVIIDNFGAGFSSLIHLRKLPIYAIKIDRFYLTDIADDPECAAIVSAIIAMAHSLKLKVIAEGIETNRQFERLRTLDWQFDGPPVCDAAQGYLFCRPGRSDLIEEFVFKQKKGELFV